MIKRFFSRLDTYLMPQKVLVIYGPRRVGKTTLLNAFLKSTTLRYKLDSGDNIRVQQLLGSRDFSQILPYAEGYELIAIDEAQQVQGIGAGLKIIVDHAPNIKIIATGSSSFDLAHQVGEPLTGRKFTITLYPIAQLELLDRYNRFELSQKLEDFLVFGSYPEIVTAKSRKEKIMLLQEIAESYLLKDILVLDKVKGSKVLFDLLKLLAFQIGSEVSYSELANSLRIDVKTVARYLDLLTKTFVITPLHGFSRNLRSEITRKHKYFFIDNGVRNAVISQFNPLEDRNDGGQLFENFVFIERLKKRTYHGILGNAYFWRTYEQQEIDLVEEGEGKLHGYECKWSTRRRATPPKLWRTAYPKAGFSAITPENYLEFIT
ncbi:MAG: ATP-binding protein [Armatimonadetes bacterium]|nr:ATP-binding protein [Armatimonadota bacterium]